jgi:hypothetical protein
MTTMSHPSLPNTVKGSLSHGGKRELENENENSELTFERRADTVTFLLFALPSADDGHQITRIKHANYP